LLISVTGSALVFREELESAFPGEVRKVEMVGERATLDEVRRLAAARYPGFKVAWIQQPEHHDLAHEVWVEKGTDARRMFIDPYGPRFVTEVGATTTFWTFLQDLHFYLLSGHTGLLVNGVGGLALVLLCVTGTAIWWPGKRKWSRALKIRSGKGWKRLNWDLHSAGGFWVLLFVFVWGLTGAYFAFPEAFIGAVNSVFPLTSPPAVEAPPSGREQLPVDQLVATAASKVPGHRVSWIGLPHHEGEYGATVYLLPADSGDSSETTYVFMNPFTGEVLQITRPVDHTLGDRVIAWLAYLHFGNFGGWPVKALWVLIGLGPAALFITGFLMWWNRVVQKAIRRRSARQNTGEIPGYVQVDS